MLGITKRISRKLKWGIAGCGKFTETAILPTFNLIPKSKINAIFSNDAKRAKALAEKFLIPKSFNNFDEFLQSDIDVVYIASANANHYEQVIKAAKAKKHILCEKPMSVTTAQAEEMVRVCKENGVQFAVDFVYRFHPLVEKTKAIIDSSLLGKILYINAEFNINLIPRDNFRYNKEAAGGGAIRDLGTHLFDLMRYLCGEVEVIIGVNKSLEYKSEVEDFASGIVKFARGGYGHFQVAYCAPKSFNRIEIIGSKGAVSLDGLISARYGSSKLSILLEGEGKKVFRKRANKLYRLLKSVTKSFLKNETPFVTGEDGLINMRLMEEFENRCSSAKS
ncbi:MAG: Gfo/Idh/MocA family oxidoreductase [Ignavibacteriaceae bacterium]|jgi:predicted dehydrogenase